MNQPIHNDYWLSRFEIILNSALVQHRAVSLIRVDLRFPEHMPVTIMDPDPDSAVISRFFESLKAKIQAYQRKKRRTNKRVRATTLHYFWCREFGKEGNDSNLLIVFYVQIMPDDFVMQLHR
ncbi:YagK/YfjJ domain-containing protein, partial [Escherichia coli]|uniref:YagK/YfjJ domain-containing protein n=1 Tax=Escherichia coli TaxID=562 RepID=UPI0020225A8C